MEAKKIKNDRQTIYILIGFVLLILLSFIFQQIDKYEFGSKPVRFCVCVITENKLVRNGRNTKFRFDLGSERYWDSYSGSDKMKEGTRVIVGFLHDNPIRNFVYEDYIVPAHIQDCPPEGWTLEEVRKLDPSFATIELPYQ